MVVFQPESDIAARMFGLKKMTQLPGRPTIDEWRRAVRQELGGGDVQFVLGNRRIEVRDGLEVMVEDQNLSQGGVLVDRDGLSTRHSNL